MEMPENCFDCMFEFHDEFELTYECPLLYKGYTNDVRTYKRLESCPIVCEVHEPHGRLGDLDELKTAFPCGESIRTESVRATIDHMPTIIPASEESKV